MRAILVNLIAAIALTGPVLAAPVRGTATLAAPASHERIVGEGGVWRCTGTSCSGPADDRARMAVASCSALAGTNGRVERFSAGTTDFGKSELARCNRHVDK